MEVKKFFSKGEGAEKDSVKSSNYNIVEKTEIQDYDKKDN